MYKSNNQRKRILVISLNFAPSGAVGGKRFSYLSRILNKKYPELHVLTLKERYFISRDGSYPLGGVIHRTWMFPPFPLNPLKKDNISKRIFNRLWQRILCLIDPYSGWIIPGFIKGLKIIKDKKISLVIATGPPFSSMVIGLLLNIISRVPLILDYRDPWSNFKSIHRKPFLEKINALLERITIRRASALVFCTQKMKADFSKALGKYTEANRYVVYNGFHNKDTTQPLSLGTNRKNMLYAGAFYGERRIELLIKPLIQLLNDGSLTADNFCFHIFGKVKNDDETLIKKYGLEGIIKQYPLVPYEEIIGYMKASDILLLISGSRVNYAVPFKFFDYLSVKRPILAIAPENSGVADIMNDIDCGRLASLKSQESIAANLRAMLFENKKYTFSGSRKYTWNEVGQRYIEIIDSL
jgi:Glycosyl transferases group 1